MAARQINLRGHRSLIKKVLVPRPVTGAVLVALGVAMMWTAWQWLPFAAFVAASGLAFSACSVMATYVWALRDRADRAMAGDGFGAARLAKTRRAASEVIYKSMRLSALTAFCGIFAAIPAITGIGSHGVIWEWSVLVIGASVGTAIYFVLIALSWDEQLREFSDKQKERQRRDEEKRAVISRLKKVDPNTIKHFQACSPELSGSLLAHGEKRSA